VGVILLQKTYIAQAAYEHIQRLTEPTWRQSLVEGNYKGGYGNGPDAHTMDSIYPFWVKKYDSERPHQAIIDWTDTPHKRQLMGIHAVEGRASWDRKDVDYLPEHLELVKSKKF